MRPKLLTVLTTLLCSWFLSPLVLIMSLYGGSFLTSLDVCPNQSKQSPVPAFNFYFWSSPRLRPGSSSFCNLLQGYSIYRFCCDCPLCWWDAVVSPNMSRIQIFSLLSTPSWPGNPIVLGPALIWMSPLTSEVCRPLTRSSSQSCPSPSWWSCLPMAHCNSAPSDWSLCGPALDPSYKTSTLCHCWPCPPLSEVGWPSSTPFFRYSSFLCRICWGWSTTALLSAIWPVLKLFA